jgi:acyl-CoA thioester hydrolase
MEPTHTHRIRVRYCETDRMGLAHHGSYVAWLEEARTEWMRVCGRTYRQMEDDGELLVVVDMQLRYLKPSTFDDVLCIEVRIVERSKVAITFGYELTREVGGERVASATTKLACVGKDGRIRRLPKELA